ncbi:hypothetical protein [Paenibacillus agaridevorans]|uniref:hypothetical protein n=1 Tax=Paenibacillus agaridevorans TaxID=171404 RepID=UPI001BE48008|nr:hypothetical protein [Paenibacillus agaridevorans]
MLTPLKVKIVAQACIIRFDRGEGTIQEIVVSYGFTPDNNSLINAQMVALRPEIEIPAA